MSATIFIDAFEQTAEVSKGLFDYRADGAAPSTDSTLNVELLTSTARSAFQYKALGDDFDAETATAKYVQSDLISSSYMSDFTQMGNSGAAQQQFMRKLAKSVFGSAEALDLFSNEYEVASSYSGKVIDMAQDLNDITGGEVAHPDSTGPYEPGHVHDEPGATNLLEPGTASPGPTGAMDVLLGLLNHDKSRFHASEEPGMEPGAEFVPMPLKENDVLQVLFTIKNHADQEDVKGVNLDTDNNPATQTILVNITLKDTIA
jgi:hypothetical protein